MANTAALNSGNDNNIFIEDVINGMLDWVRVVDKDDNLLYINKAMSEGLNGDFIGTKCYTALGRESPCENCTSRKAIFTGKPFEKEEIILDKIFSVMSSPLKNKNGEIFAAVEVLRDVTQMKQLQKIMLVQNIKLENDLAIAKKLQCSLLPKDISLSKVDFSFLYKPCEALGGDFLDIFPIDSDHFGVYIADVSGHGVPASILTIFLRSSINKKTLSPATALNELYSEFNLNNFNQDLYITVFFAVINTKENIMTFSNAGHNVSPIVFNKNRFELLRVPGIPISDWLENPEYINKTVPLSKGDAVFLYTDGIIEMRNKNGELFGEERLLEILLNCDSDLNTTLNKIVDSAYKFADYKNSSEIADDVTVALLRIKQ